MAVTIYGKKNLFESKPEAVLFDLDNTFYDYEQAHRPAQAAVREFLCVNLNIKPKAFDSLFTKARDSLKQRVGETAASHSRLLYFQRVIELSGMRTQTLLALDSEQLYWRTYFKHMTLFPDVVDFLAHLRACHVKTAVVTDLTAQIQFRKLLYLDIDSYFDVVVTSEEAGVDKCGKTPFTLAFEKLGCTNKQKLWVIGDNTCDVITPKALGGSIITLQKIHGMGKVSKGCDASFRQFEELYKKVKGWR